MKKIIGLTLIELMLALTLSILLLSGVYSIFVFSQKILQTQMNLMQIQESIRVVAETVTHDIQHARLGNIRSFQDNEMAPSSDGITIRKKCSYFIGKTTRQHNDGSVVYVLYKKLFGRAKEEWVEDVDEMKVKYSIVERGSIIGKKADEIMDWSKVVGVSITLTLRSQTIKKRVFIYAAL